eukprot:1428345-Heterocapsa_arctica.AAC.1
MSSAHSSAGRTLQSRRLVEVQASLSRVAQVRDIAKPDGPVCCIVDTPAVANVLLSAAAVSDT